MALFFPDDSSYNEAVRMTGFDRYRQLLSFYWGSYLKAGLLLTVGALPLALGIAAGIMTSSIMVMIPASLVGGMIMGPFLAMMYDIIFRGFRDAPGRFGKSAARALRQNWKEALLPGAILGLLIGMYAFMAYMLWWTDMPVPSGLGILLYLISAWLLLIVSSLFWPQLVLFRQPVSDTFRNIILFTAKYLWRVAGGALLKLVLILVLVLFAPWTLILVPFLGWYLIFADEFFFYEKLNEELHIEKLIDALNRTARPEEEQPEETL